jgi:biopolymer transport protein ExbD
MAMDVGVGGGYASEINITPLVDVVLVLLIIFMAIVPVMMRGYDVDVPGEAVAPEPPADRAPQVVLRIDLAECPVVDPPASPGLPAGCTVRLDGDAVPAERLSGRLAETFAGREPADRVLFLAAHPRVNYEGVLRILDAARAGVDGLRVGMVTDGEPPPRG